jgi:hypothetical protein
MGPSKPPCQAPMPSQALSDLGLGIVGDVQLEILQPAGTRVGSIMSADFVGGPAPPVCRKTLRTTCGDRWNRGYLGARGALMQPLVTVRFAPMEEDPGNRRTHGGGRGRSIVSLMPLA